MERPARLLFCVCLTTLLVAAGFKDLSAAEEEASAQLLLEEDIPDQVTTAHLTRLPDAYVVHVVLDRPARPVSTTADRPASAAVPAPTVVPAPTRVDVPTTVADVDVAPPTSTDRPSFFIGVTIANLRGLDPTFGCRVLPLLQGRRVGGVQQTPPPSPATNQPSPAMNQPYPPQIKDDRVDVWLLKADGTQILPALYSCDWARTVTRSSRPHAEITYEFPRVSTDQAVAVAIRIEDRYFIEKL